MTTRSDAHRPEFHREHAWKHPVVAATTTNIVIATALNAGDVIDGVTLALGDRVLAKDQTTGSQNGIYDVGPTPVRSYDLDSGIEAWGCLVRVLSGTVNATKVFGNTNLTLPTIDTTALTFAEFGAGGGGSALTVEEADGSPTDSAVTKIVVPNGSLALASHVATLTFPSGGGGGSSAQAFVGKNAIGATWETLAVRKSYWKKIVLTAPVQFASIDVYLRPSTDNVEGINVMVAADNASAPGVLLAANAMPVQGMYLSNSGTMPGAGRWLSIPITPYLAAGTVWIGFEGDGALYDVAVDTTGGTDQTFTPSSFFATGGYPSVYTITTTVKDYSIRASVLTLTVPTAPGTIVYPSLKPTTPTDDFATTLSGWSAHSNGGTFVIGNCQAQGADWGGSSLEMQFSAQCGTIFKTQANTDFDFTFGGVKRVGMGDTNMMMGIAALDASGNGIGVVAYNDGNCYIGSFAGYSYSSNSDTWGAHGHNVSPEGFWFRLKRVSGVWTAYMSQSGRAWDKTFATRSDAVTVTQIHFGVLYNGAATYTGRIIADYYQKDV